MNSLCPRTCNVLLLALLQLLFCPRLSRGQAVAVTMLLDTNQIGVGQSTTLHVMAQVVPGLQPSSLQIFSWCVDVLNTNGAVASAAYSAMSKSASDNSAGTSSTGSDSGANRRAIYDTFMNLPGAGVLNPVELMSIPVSGSAAGKTRFLVQAGTGVSLTDFIVAASGGGLPYTNGNYSAAFADLAVTNSTPCVLSLQVTPVTGNGGPGGTLQLSFAPCPGRTHTVETRAALGDVAGWQALPGAPHNSGIVIVTNTASLSFYRVCASLP